MKNKISNETYAKLKAVADSIRLLTVDAIEASTTGHPGMPMGMADLGAVLFGEILKHNPKNDTWLNRDRFVLSAGHGSLLLYSLLHLSGYGLSLEEIKKFRRVNSLTPGHPEYGHTVGVETTTGPLGAGFATAVGMAMGERILSARFNTDTHKIFDHFTYVVCGDGCLMEGVSAEAASLAGHHQLEKLIVFYDSNKVSIEGPTDITFTEDVAKRFEAYGWQALEGNAHDMREILDLIQQAKVEKGKPSIIILNSVIGTGSPGMAGKHKVHGSRLGEEEAAITRKYLGCPDENQMFYVHPEAYEYFDQQNKQAFQANEEWNANYESWQFKNPEKKQALDIFLTKGQELYASIDFPRYQIGDRVSTRQVSGEVLNNISKMLPNFVGGSADLSTSNMTEMPTFGDFTIDNPTGKTIRFGVREHAMGSIGNGLALEAGFRPFCATLVLFIDYMRPSMRLASLMKLPVIYILTHDSIFLGGDGPTHQPIEHLNSLRIIPDFRVLRPGDPAETVVAWQMALERLDGPTAMFFSRQALPVYEKADQDWKNNVRKNGAYIVINCKNPDIIVLATGSEVEMAINALEKSGKKGLVVSVMSRELLGQTSIRERNKIMPPGVPVIAVEAGSHHGWTEFTKGKKENIFCIDRFGASGRPEEVAEYLGFTVENLTDFITSVVDEK